MKNLELKGLKNTFIGYQYFMDTYNFFFLRHGESYIELWLDKNNNNIKKDVKDICSFLRREYKKNNIKKITKTES